MTLLHMREMGAKAHQEGGERLDRERRDDERHAEPERIDREQAGALRHRRLRRRDRQDRRQDRTDARRPAEREGEPHHIGAPQPDRLCTWNRACRCSSAIGVRPRKCRPMTMMTMPATIASSCE